MDQIKRIMRPPDVPDTGLLCDLLWSDPDKDIVGWGENDRGVSFTFGQDVVAAFLKRHDLDLVCRAHQVVEDGYEFFAKRQLVTLFSAPNCAFRAAAGARAQLQPPFRAPRHLCPPPGLPPRRLRRVRQRRRHDVRRRHAHVLLPDPEARREEEQVRPRARHARAGALRARRAARHLPRSLLTSAPDFEKLTDAEKSHAHA